VKTFSRHPKQQLTRTVSASFSIPSSSSQNINEIHQRRPDSLLSNLVSVSEMKISDEQKEVSTDTDPKYTKLFKLGPITRGLGRVSRRRDVLKVTVPRTVESPPTETCIS